MRGSFWRIPALMALALWAAPAQGQTADADARRDAAKAFEQGEKAFSARDYARAASRFAEAYRLAPHPNAIWNEARALLHAGEKARAANAYAKYLRDAGPDARERAEATRELEGLAKKLLRIDASAQGFDTVLVDDQRVDGPSVYVEPGRHVVEGRAGEHVVRAEASGDAGSVASVSLVLPAPAPPPPPVAAPAPSPSPAPAPAPTLTPALPPPPPPARESTSSGWSPAVFWVGAGVTLLAAGATTWSGLDTLAFKKTYDTPGYGTGSNYDSGVGRMNRTNLLLGISIASGVFTGVTAIWLVDWRGSHGTRTSVGVGPGALEVRGTFR